ncbi:hypothetical protein SH2C18_17310 [Clostridium sediminicola]|uniref:DUF1292 domain-containing protein n=1 Tax=Clostridium sediminicola TaxID=3114879 RepID=UPI0031F25CF1
MDKHNCNCNEHNHDHDCNCNHESEDMSIMTLILDDDKELKCNVVGIFPCDEREYIALLPMEEEDVLLYRYEENGEEVALNNIEDDAEFEKVSDAFWDMVDEEADEEMFEEANKEK